MMVSTRGRYALRVMIDLAEHNNGKFIPLKDIAERQEISEKYLESIVKSLTKADVLEGLRGKGGGYRLTRPAEEYNVYEILKLTEGSMAPVSCLEDAARECERRGMCATLPVWEGLEKVVGNICRVSPFRELTKQWQPGDKFMINFWNWNQKLLYFGKLFHGLYVVSKGKNVVYYKTVKNALFYEKEQVPTKERHRFVYRHRKAGI